MPLLSRAALAATLLISCAAEAEPSYILFDVPQAVSTAPVGIASDGTVAGNYSTGGNDNSAFLRAPDGSFETISVSNLPDITITGISEKGLITGYGRDPDLQKVVSFVRDTKGKITTIGPDGNGAYAQAVNDKAGVTGYLLNEDFYPIGFVGDKSGQVTTFAISGAFSVTPRAINKKGEIVGQCDCDAGLIGFMRTKDGTVSTITLPDGPAEDAVAVNGKGTIAGAASTGAYILTAKGKATVFDLSDGTGGTAVLDINDAGVAVGVFTENSGTHGFIRDADGTITKFDPPKKTFFATSPFPFRISNDGIVAGSYRKQGETATHGFIRLP